MLWQIVFCTAGVLCAAYYAVIGLTLRRWNSTFAKFWPLLGILLLFLGAGQNLEEPVPLVIRGAAGILLTIFLIGEAAILTGMFSCRERELDYLVVPGAHVAGVKVTDSLKRRLDRAAEYLEKYPGTRVVVSGGKGHGEDITEAEAMRKYLVSQGIRPERIFCEDRSATTKENLQFSAGYLEDIRRPIGIVTNNFHMYRACRYAKKAGYQSPYRLCAGCHPVLFINYMVREGFAVWKLWILG